MRLKLVFILFVGLMTPVVLLGQETPDTTASALADTTGLLRMGMLDAIVVTASRAEQRVADAPAALTVIGSEKISEVPAAYYSDLIRMVPGVNASEMSAGDMTITPRRAAGVIPSGQLTMIDNRRVYNEFNGQTWWNSFAIDPHEIKQIEVLRGPSSAVWGANAMDGVVNIITKSPREMQGTYLKLGAGNLGILQGAFTHAGVSGKFGYKLSGSYFEQDAYDRPTGTVPGTEGPANPGGTPYIPYENQGSEQPKLDVRLDYDQDDRTTLSVSGGFAGLNGLVLTPAGPADYDDGSYWAYGKADWMHDSMRITGYANLHYGRGEWLLDGNPHSGNTQTYSLSFSDARIAWDRHLLSYGADFRNSQFNLSLIPRAEPRSEAGAYIQDDIRFGDKFRWVIGARVDYVDRMGIAVSPRISFMFTPVKGNTFRLSYNRAFRAPTTVENYVFVPNVTIITVPDTSGGSLDLEFPLLAGGNPDLEQEKLDNFEVGWVGKLGNRVEATVSLYRNQLNDAIKLIPVEFYSSSNPPPGWPLDPAVLDEPPLNGIPSVIRTENVGTINQQGVEVGLSVRMGKPWTVFANYSWQDDPETEGIAAVPTPSGELVEPINIAPTHRFNVGVFWDTPRFYANANVNYQDTAFWTDVLDSRFWGPTDSFTILNVGVGARVFRQQMTVSLNGQNLLDERVQQHVWTDIISRKVTVQLTYRF